VKQVFDTVLNLYIQNAFSEWLGVIDNKKDSYREQIARQR